MKNALFAAVLGLAMFGLIIPDADAGRKHKTKICHGGYPGGDDEPGDPPETFCEVDLPLEISGTVPCECELEVVDSDIDVFADSKSVSGLAIGSISAYCNTTDGFTVTMTSGNGGLAHNKSPALLPYTLDVAGTALSFSPSVGDLEVEETIAEADALQDAAVELTVDATGALEGEYSDTVTIEVAGIL
ncbi:MULTISPECIES: hypothetical protein [Vibrio]|uniref:Fimbrial-type adhesion domain-containing protein n=1 Tax=Vibrio halioticoli NBRC 102217 TaxID=1219072 RepID=V5HII9_9VIBR|nr:MULTISPECIES: hypothetical protein [Vibrio]MPW36323.1 hypothetical protein [Vibrio sp. B1Z05]GAD89150.1 hypothetical protein VHA01S_016_00070 [Vibrio halioticoli NBRC 102217]